MSDAISVDRDSVALDSLEQLEAEGMSRSEAVSLALVAAAERLRRNRLTRIEVAALEADERDRDEMRIVAEMMAELRAPW